MGSRRGLVQRVVAVLTVVACGGCSPHLGTAGVPAAPAPSATPSLSPSPSPSPTSASSHVFVIVLENRSYSSVTRSPYLTSLAQQYAIATDYHSVAQPSLPNYLALTSGSTWGIRDDGYHPLPSGGLGEQLTAAGMTWKAYAEGFTGDCFNSPYPYALKHNPFPYYGDSCPPNVVPISQLGGDLGGVTPRLSWIIPGLCNDGHDCSAATSDGWLATVVPQIVASPAWQQNGVLYITWDEGNGSDDQFATLIVAPNLTSHTATSTYTHYSLLASIEDRLGVPRLGEAAAATAITEVFNGP